MKHNPMKTICLSLVIMLLAATVLPAFAAGPKGAYVVDIVEPRDRLNVHGSPSIDDVIDHLEDGTVVQYRHSDDGWWYVEWWDGNDRLGGGYVDGKYLSAIDAQSEKFTCVDNVYIHSRSHIAQGECYKYHVDKLTVGEKVSVLEQDGNWSLIDYKGGTGWVPSIYLVRVG